MKEGTENIEVLKLEWGPEFGPCSWDDAKKHLVELNEGLPEDMQWRMPTREDLLDAYNKKIPGFLTEAPNAFSGGDSRSVLYWSSEEATPGSAWSYWFGGDGGFPDGPGGKDGSDKQTRVRYCRNIKE